MRRLQFFRASVAGAITGWLIYWALKSLIKGAVVPISDYFREDWPGAVVGIFVACSLHYWRYSRGSSV